jgi:hypothetical protein
VGTVRLEPDGLSVIHVLNEGAREHRYPLEQLRPLTPERLMEMQSLGVPLHITLEAGSIVGVDAPRSEETKPTAESGADGGFGALPPSTGESRTGANPALQGAGLWMESASRIMRLVDDGVNRQLVAVLPSHIPTSFRGKIELIKNAGKTYVCQHLPHPGACDYQLYLSEDVPLSLGELERAQRRETTVIVTMQNGRVTDAKIPQQQGWDRGLGWYRGRGMYWGR